MIPEVSALGSLPQQPRPAPDVAEAVTAAELMRRDLPASSWLLDGMLPQGVTLLAGRPKAGKSWLALQIALAVATGTPLPGGPTAVAGAGLYLALEDTQNRLKGRLQRLLAALGVEAPNGLNLMTSWPRLDQGGWEHLAAWLQLHPCVRLLVVDTLAMIRSPRQSSGYENDYRTIDELRALSARFGLAVLVVHHLRKAPARDPFDAISGTHGLTAGADTLWVLSRSAESGEAVLHLRGRDLDSRELPLAWDTDRSLWSVQGRMEERRMSKERAAVLEILRDAELPQTAAELAKALDKKLGAMKVLLWRMKENGLVRSGDGFYWAA